MMTDSAEDLNEPLALRPSLEALLLVAEEPVDHRHLAQIVDHPPADVAAELHDIAGEYHDQGRGFQLCEVARGWRLFTREEYATVVETFVREDRQAKLSQAALETLAIVAYQQPVSRSRIAAVRGVSVDAVVRNLVNRGLLDETGNEPETGAVLYGTSDYFLERMGLTDVTQLPDLAPLLPAMDELGEPMDLHQSHEVAHESDESDAQQDTGGD